MTNEFTMIDGPEGYLNTGSNGRHAYSYPKSVAAYEATRWLYDYVSAAVRDNDERWEDFISADYIMGIYAIIYENELGVRREEYLTRKNIMVTGMKILDAAVAGAGDETIRKMFRRWDLHIQGA